MKNNLKLYNLILPIWLLWLLPLTWIIVLPCNYFIDLLVVVLTLKYLHIMDVRSNAKLVIFRVWIFGFIADFIGTIFMFLANIINFDSASTTQKWWYDNISNPVSYSPFESIYSILWVTGCVAITGICIYLFNYKYCLNKSNLTNEQKKKLALALAIFTAPYTFYIPTMWFF